MNRDMVAIPRVRRHLNGMRALAGLWARLSATFLILAATACAQAEGVAPRADWHTQLNRDHPLVGRIWSPAASVYLQPDELLRRIAAADFVILGEKHDNPDHHAIQAWVVERLLASGRRPALAFEMIAADQAPRLEAYQSDHPGTSSGLGDALGWDKTGWPEWSLYEPIAAAIVGAGLPILAANLSQKDAMGLARGNAPSDNQLRVWRLDQSPAPEVARALADDIRESHCGHLPEDRIPGMVLAQRARDAVMARAMIAGAARPETDGTVLIAGTGHARSDRGVPMHLRQLEPGSTVFSLAIVEVSPDLPEPASYADNGGLPFDALWFTPRLDDKDHCALLLQHFKKKR